MAWPHVTRANLAADQAVTQSRARGLRARDRELRNAAVQIKFAESSATSTDWTTLGQLTTLPLEELLSDGTLNFEATLELKVDSGTQGEVRLIAGTDSTGSAATVTGTAYADTRLSVEIDATDIDVQARVTSGTDAVYARADWRADAYMEDAT